MASRFDHVFAFMGRRLGRHGSEVDRLLGQIATLLRRTEPDAGGFVVEPPLPSTGISGFGLPMYAPPSSMVKPLDVKLTTHTFSLWQTLRDGGIIDFGTPKISIFTQRPMSGTPSSSHPDVKATTEINAKASERKALMKTLAEPKDSKLQAAQGSALAEPKVKAVDPKDVKLDLPKPFAPHPVDVSTADLKAFPKPKLVIPNEAMVLAMEAELKDAEVLYHWKWTYDEKKHPIEVKVDAELYRGGKPISNRLEQSCKVPPMDWNGMKTGYVMLSVTHGSLVLPCSVDETTGSARAQFSRVFQPPDPVQISELMAAAK